MLWNFIRSESYRAVKLKCFYILPVVMLALTFIIGTVVMRMDLFSMLGYTQQDIEEIGELGSSYEGMQRSFEDGFNAGIDMTMDSAESGEPVEINMFGIGIYYYEDIPEIFHQNMNSLDQLILIAIFAGIFMGDVFISGNDKNLLISTKRRGTLFAARLLVFAGYTMLLHILRLIFVVFSVLCLGDSVKWNIDKSFVLYFFITYFICVTFGFVLCALAYMTRSKAATITVGVIVASGVLTMAITLANYLISRAFDVKFDVSRYLLTQNLAALSLKCDGDYVFKTIVIVSVYFAVALVSGALVARKRDI